MTDTTKPDLSREAVERLAERIQSSSYGWCAIKDTNSDTLRALLDAKEAAEREAKERADAAEGYRKTIRGLMDQLNAAKEAAHG
ncbi:hypothetical protein [Falsirhodobacter xinxiangensis]|uniref:hypothetical protein n=1 Tax=Falsirhodobacter xinxiangensis TaxID=2530049 RepID=UPI0010AB1F48|nr:hypothetical protein [Rhodobacter xinxiangensis]